MPSNFSDAGKRIETAISVPELPIGAIHNRLRDANGRHRSNILLACALAAVAILGSGTVLATAMYGGVRIWLSGDKAAVAMRSFAVVQNPKADDLRRVTTDATFPVVLPVGVPKGMHMDLLLFSPADHPNFIEVTYRNAATDARSGQFLLFDASTVNDGEAPMLPDGETLQVGQVTHWNVGRETVVVRGAGQAAAIRAAMASVTPAESFAQTIPMLYRTTVLGVQDKLADVAEAIAPSVGRSALIDRDGLRQIAGAAASRKALLFTRATMFDTFPMIAGKADFGHAKRHRIEETAVSANGVRALATVLASKPCENCEMLINERSGRAYWIWMLAFDSSTPPTKYVIARP